MAAYGCAQPRRRVGDDAQVEDARFGPLRYAVGADQLDDIRRDRPVEYRVDAQPILVAEVSARGQQPDVGAIDRRRALEPLGELVHDGLQLVLRHDMLPPPADLFADRVLFATRWYPDILTEAREGDNRHSSRARPPIATDVDRGGRSPVASDAVGTTLSPSPTVDVCRPRASGSATGEHCVACGLGLRMGGASPGSQSGHHWKKVSAWESERMSWSSAQG